MRLWDRRRGGRTLDCLLLQLPALRASKIIRRSGQYALREGQKTEKNDKKNHGFYSNCHDFSAAPEPGLVGRSTTKHTYDI